jgi:hypothetical protein
MLILPEFGALVTNVRVFGVQVFDKRNEAGALLFLAAKFKRLDFWSCTGMLDVRRDCFKYALRNIGILSSWKLTGASSR